MSVVGTIEQYCVGNPFFCGDNFGTPSSGGSGLSGAEIQKALATSGPVFTVQSANAYESRVLQGIWAAAPYLHNGSVQSLAQLLTSPAQRLSTFCSRPEL